MNRYDKEERIIDLFQDFKISKTRMLPLNLKNIKIYRSIHNKKKWAKWIDTSAKNELPPDFYNEKLKLMMDVMRIDDHAFVDENGRVINRHNERESKLIEEFIKRNKSFKEIAEKGNIFINPDSGLRGAADHNYDFYINNFQRVIGKHINKIEKYKKNHPGFKTIFFVFDESSAYVKSLDEKRPTHVGEIVFGELHFWWKDKNMLKIIKNSEIDYLIWMCPYKYSFSIPKVKLPMSVIFDVKKINYDDCINYNKKNMQSMEM